MSLKKIKNEREKERRKWGAREDESQRPARRSSHA